MDHSFKIKEKSLLAAQARSQTQEWGGSFLGEVELIWLGVWGTPRPPAGPGAEPQWGSRGRSPRKLLRFKVDSATKNQSFVAKKGSSGFEIDLSPTRHGEYVCAETG